MSLVSPTLTKKTNILFLRKERLTSNFLIFFFFVTICHYIYSFSEFVHGHVLNKEKIYLDNFNVDDWSSPSKEFGGEQTILGGIPVHK